MRPRHFRPWFLIPCGRYLVALDEIQPVAAVFDRRGALVRTVHWTWSAPPQQALLHPCWACSVGASIWGADGAASEVVRLDIDTIGQGSRPVRIRLVTAQNTSRQGSSPKRRAASAALCRSCTPSLRMAPPR